MAKKPAVTVPTDAAFDNSTVEYIVKTTMGYVTVKAEQVEGKSPDELEAFLSGNDYLNRIGAHEILKVTRTPIFTR